MYLVYPFCGLQCIFMCFSSRNARFYCVLGEMKVTKTDIKVRKRTYAGRRLENRLPKRHQGSNVFAIAEDFHKATGKAVDVYEKCDITEGTDFYNTTMNEGVRIVA